MSNYFQLFMFRNIKLSVFLRNLDMLFKILIE